MTTAGARLLITNGTLIDGTGRAPRPSGVIVVEGNEIAHVDGVEAVGDVRDSGTVIDATGKFIMPGLIDGHVHLSSNQGALPTSRG